jgi:hypothetical protein
LPNDSFLFQWHGDPVEVRDDTSGIILCRAIYWNRSAVKIEACGSCEFTYALHL